MTKNRKGPRLKQGDTLPFPLNKGKVTLRKAEWLDRAFLKLAETAFEHWNSPQDEATFHDL